MTLAHEKRAAPLKSDPFLKGTADRTSNQIDSDNTKTTRSKLYSVTFEGGTLWVLLFGQTALLIIATIAIVGGHGG